MVKERTNKTDRCRNWCFTLNNYTKKEIEQIIENIDNNIFIYICWGFELCPSTGTPHLQGYMEFKNAKTLSAVKKIKGLFRANLSNRGGTKLEAVSYCAKELGKKVLFNELLKENNEEEAKALFESLYDTDKKIVNALRKDLKIWRSTLVPTNEKFLKKLFFEAGSFEKGLKPGARSDIDSVRDIVKSGGNMKQIIESANSFQALQFGKTLLTYQRPTRNWETEVYWITGPGGSGKTKFCYDNCPDKNDVWESSDSLKWFDGYDGEGTVIFDDFRASQASLPWLLRLTDRTPLRVPIKGGFMNWCPKIIFITSVQSPEDCYATEVEDSNHEQLLRRIDRIITLKKLDSLPEKEINEEKAERIRVMEANDKIVSSNSGAAQARINLNLMNKKNINFDLTSSLLNARRVEQ